MTDVFIKAKNLETEQAGTQGRHHINRKAEIRVMLLQAKEHQRLPRKPPEARREA